MRGLESTNRRKLLWKMLQPCGVSLSRWRAVNNARSIARSSTIVASSVKGMGASARAMNPSTCMASGSLAISRQADA
ncbi:hypothetical protein D9M68_472890 [compost metagenome]